LRIGLVEHRLKGTRIDLEQNLALPDERAFLVALLNEISTYLRLDLSVDITIQRRDPFTVDGDIPLYDADNFDLSGRGRGSRVWALTTEKH
jgi:hypothetical protein